MPPAAVRRPLTVTAGLILFAATLGAAPALLALAWLARAAGRPKPLIAVRLVLTYCARELGVLFAGAGLWALAGAGAALRRPALVRAHWRLLRWFAHGLAARSLQLLDVRIDEHCSAPAAAALADPAPLIVLSRHAGPGDTFLLIDRLACHYGRRPSVVLRHALVLDPAIDLLTSRLPHGVIDSADSEESEATIEALARGLGPGGLVLLYPEGGNFTAPRRRAALRSLRRRGRRRAAAAAQRMHHVLPPRPSGVLAAHRGNPRAPIVFVAHTGLGLAAFPREIYRELPIGRTLRLRIWAAAPDEVPADEEEAARWLNGWWQRIDEWIAEQHTEQNTEPS